MKYAIVDIETTGGSPVTEKITEIAIYIFDGQQITDEFCTLINPEKKIPYHISNLTGITNAMVADAPRFFEVAKKVVELTQDCLFVAHNVNFDYQFVRNEFKRLGYSYERDKLCTVQLSRKLIPGMASYSLGKLCSNLHITIEGRHRAGGDALATVKLFELLLQRSKAVSFPIGPQERIDEKALHPNFDPESLKKLPEATGTYYLFNDKQQLIYIGKSKNIRNRIYTHFRNYATRKAIEMINETAEVDYELTGSELIALLKESHEIKQHKPRHNRAQRRTASMYGLYHYTDINGYLCFTLDQNHKRSELPLRTFANLRSGKSFLNQLVDDYELCQKLCGVYPSGGACFAYEIAKCQGACIGKEAPESYNRRALKIIDLHSYRHDSFFILDTGRQPDELAVIQIERGKYLGYGYIHEPYYRESPDTLPDVIQRFDDNRDVQQIIRNYLWNHPEIRLIPVSC